MFPKTGKFFDENDDLVHRILAIDGVEAVSKSIQETALFEYQRIPNAGTLLGVDDQFRSITSIDSTMVEGSFLLKDDEHDYAILGSGMARNLSVDVLNVFESLSVHMPDRKAAASSVNPFKTRIIKPFGVFSVQQDIDNEVVLVPLSFAQSLLGRSGRISALGLSLVSGADPDEVQSQVQALVGNNLIVKNRYQQDEEFLKLMNIEKWMAFMIACLMLLLIAFNLLACLWMIILDKRRDIAILKAMGSTSQMIRKIFMRLGVFYTIMGLIIGILLALVLYGIQKQFGVISLSQGFVVDAYPIRMIGFDIIVVSTTVLLIGVLASIPAARRAARLTSSIREA